MPRSKVTYLHNGTIVSLRDAVKYPTLVGGSDVTDDPGVIQLFEGNEEFSQWADQTAYGDKIREVLRLLNEEVLPERDNEEWVEKMQRLALERTQEVFGEFANLLGRSPIDEEVINKAMVERTPLTPKLLDPILFYDRVIERLPPTGAPEDPRTNTLPVPSGWWPALGWVGWDNRPRSTRVFGLNALCENEWFNFFGGRWCWLIGFNGLFNLRDFGFDRITSSVISF